MSDDFEKALIRMQFYCSRSEKCEYDVRQKMFQAKIDINLHDEIIDSLNKSRKNSKRFKTENVIFD